MAEDKTILFITSRLTSTGMSFLFLLQAPKDNGPVVLTPVEGERRPHRDLPGFM